MATAAKKTAPRSVAKAAAAKAAVDTTNYRVLSHVTINRKGYDVGETVTDLSEAQAEELVALKVIEKVEASTGDTPAE